MPSSVLDGVSDQYSGFSPDWQIQFLRHWPLLTDADSSDTVQIDNLTSAMWRACIFRNRTRGQQSLGVVQRSGLYKRRISMLLKR
jgi:hypothetical protein